MGNTVQPVAKTAVYAYGSPNFAETQREQQEMVKFLSSNKNKLNVDSVVFEGGGAKVAAYLGSAEVYSLTPSVSWLIITGIGGIYIDSLASVSQ